MADVGRPILYADSIGVKGSPFGFSMMLGISPPGSQEILEHTLLCMSPQMAKALALMIEYHLKAIEENLGEIRLPNEFLSSIGRDDLIQY